jgi:nucleoside-diphosphate-sugar epimerase
MIVAITGASGFIGSYTVAALHRAGHEVHALVRPTSRRDHIEKFVAKFIEGDAADPQAIAGLVAGAEAVIHDAADWEALRRSPISNFERNVMGSLRLLEASRQAGARQFLFVSSVAVYHEIPPSANGRITEEMPAWPSSIYGAYKAAIEPHLKAYHVAYDMNTSSWRPAAVYGVDPRLERSQWYDIIVAAKRGGAVDVSQGGKITHVQDIADALTCALGDDSVAGQFYNLVDRYLYWQEVAELAKELTGSAAEIIDRKGPGPKNQFDCRKAIDFFERQGNKIALRRGVAGVREYVAQLLPMIK